MSDTGHAETPSRQEKSTSRWRGLCQYPWPSRVEKEEDPKDYLEMSSQARAEEDTKERPLLEQKDQPSPPRLQSARRKFSPQMPRRRRSSPCRCDCTVQWAALERVVRVHSQALKHLVESDPKRDPEHAGALLRDIDVGLEEMASAVHSLKTNFEEEDVKHLESPDSYDTEDDTEEDDLRVSAGAGAGSVSPRRKRCRWWKHVSMINLLLIVIGAALAFGFILWLGTRLDNTKVQLLDDVRVLRDKVSGDGGLEDKVAKLQAKVDTLEDGLVSLNSSVNSTDTRLDHVEDDVSDLKQDVNHLEAEVKNQTCNMTKINIEIARSEEAMQEYIDNVTKSVEHTIDRDTDIVLNMTDELFNEVQKLEDEEQKQNDDLQKLKYMLVGVWAELAKLSKAIDSIVTVFVWLVRTAMIAVRDFWAFTISVIHGEVPWPPDVSGWPEFVSCNETVFWFDGCQPLDRHECLYVYSAKTNTTVELDTHINALAFDGAFKVVNMTVCGGRIVRNVFDI